MKNMSQKSLLILVLIILCFTNSNGQEKIEKSKQTLEKGTITIKVKEGVGPFQKQEGIVSFGINSLDQIAARYGVNKLTERFIHKPIPKNSGLPDLSRIYQIEFPDKYNVVIVAKEFSKDPHIEYAEPIQINYPAEEPNDPYYSQQWHLPKIQAPDAWDIHKGQNGDSTVTMAITDSGIDWDHPDLIDNIWNNLGEDNDGDGHTIEWNGSMWIYDPGDLNNVDNDGNGYIDDLIGWNIQDNNNIVTDTDGHGTKVAGIAGATTNNLIGVASISYNIKVMPVKGYYYNSIIYAAENGADVINCSWGGFVFSNAEMEVIEYVTGLGSIVVAAAHNYNVYDPIYPAAYPKAISVAGVDVDDIRVPYTNYGPSIDVSAPSGWVAAGIYTTLNGGGYGTAGNGTSFATPIVTGLMGLIKSYRPTWPRDQLFTQLLGTTDNIDLLNPGYEHLLGTGRINAYHALADIGVTVPQELKLYSSLLKSESSNPKLNRFGEDEIIDIGLRIHNFSHGVIANNFSIILSTNDPDVQILDGEYFGSIPGDDIINLVDEFQIQFSANAPTHFSTITFNFSAEVPIVVGSVSEFKIIVNSSGSLVWEGVENGQDYSGEFIKHYLSSNSYQVLYTTEPVLSYNGFDALFLSFGNYGSNGTTNTAFNDYHAAIVQEYLESGGKVYLEGGDALGYDQVANSDLLSLFGLASAEDGSNNIINSLQGQNGTPTQGMLFTSSTQLNNTWIDKYYPHLLGAVAFNESGYGDVAVVGTGITGQKTFCFSYALAELADANSPSTRDSLLNRIIDFFGIEPLQLPSSPTLFSPVNLSVIDSATVLFKWMRSLPQVTKYWLELDTTEQFISSIIDSSLTDTTHLFTNLQNNKSYWWRVRAYNAAGWGEFSEVWKFSTSIVSVNNEEILVEYALQQNYPNPFNPSTIISWQSPVGSHQTIKIFDVLGNEIATLIDEYKPAGKYEVEFNAEKLSSGIYFYQLKAGDFIETKKMILLK